MLRAGHLAGVVGFGAALLGATGLPEAALALLLVFSGLAMAALDAWSNPDWLKELAGLSLLVKFLLLGWFGVQEEARPALFWVILVFSVLFAHAPASFRHRQLP